MPTRPSPEEQILGIVTNHWQAHGVGLAAKLELADHLADGPLTAGDLAARTGTHAPSLYRLLRALESTGIFAQTKTGAYENTPASDCLRRHKSGSNWAWVRFTLCPGAPVYEGWRGLPLAVEKGEPGFDLLHGESNWQHMQANPEAYSIFNLAMRDLAATIGPAVAEAIDWNRYAVIADIGGGIGSQLSEILAVHPGPRGILFDLPDVVAEAPNSDRIEPMGGDFFEDIPVAADVYVLRWVLHDWSDEECLRLLGNLRKTMKPNTRLMIVESVLPEGPEFDMGKWMDLNMMVMATGRERTAAEFEALLEPSGFALQTIEPTASPLSILVCRPE
ncbi:MAG: methyltransferase [Pacificimonas sp.]|jgi:hypothetical protein|nr:methyltransferase [Pacificimonas sp.]